MKFKFDADLDYQKSAFSAVTGIFEGQPTEDSLREFRLHEESTLHLINGVSNKLILSEEQILENLREVQKENRIPASRGK